MTDHAIAQGQPVPRRRGLFYGWVMVWAGFVVMMVGFGAAYSFPAFFAPLKTEFNVSRGDTSLVFGIAGFLYFFLGNWSGPAGDRIGPRPVIVFGTIMTALGLYLAGTATRIEQVYWGYGLGVGIGVGCMYVPAIGAVQRWFAVRRATASGIAIMGIGVGTFLAPMVSQELIAMMDWRQAYTVLAGIVLVAGLLGGLILENNPAARGLFPDGADGPPGGAHAGPSMDIRQARQTLPLWMIYFSALFCSIGLFIPFVHLTPFATDLGLSAKEGVWIFSSIGIGSIVGRAALGPIAQRFGCRPVVAGLYLGLAFMFVYWIFADSLVMLLVFGFFFGALYGGFVALAPTLLTDYYGVAHAGGILGFVYSCVGFGALLGPPVAGYMYDITRNYELPIMIGASLMVVASLVMILMPTPRRWRAHTFGETV